MNIAFVGVKPSSLLQRLLLSNGFELSVLKKLPTSKSVSFHLIAYHPSSLKQLSELPALRKRFSNAWIAIVLKQSWITKEKPQNELLKHPEYDDFWILEQWEQTFLLSMQKMLKHTEKLHKLQQEVEELNQIKSEKNSLLNQTNKLVQQIETDIAIASNLQRKLMPQFFPNIPGVDMAVKFIPAAGPGGDYFDIFEFGDKKRFGVLLADSKSHGMAATLLSVLIKVRLNEMKERFPDSKSFVEFLNSEIQNLHQQQMTTMSLLYGIFDRSNLSFQYTVAGKIKPLLWRLGESTPLQTAGNPPLGGVDYYDFKENRIPLKPSDLLIFHTDGLEAPIQNKETNARERILEILYNNKGTPDPIEVQNEVLGLISSFTENQPLDDDITLIQFAINKKALYVASESK